MSSWFFAIGEQRQGPISTEELGTRFQRGEITPDALVWREGMDGWRPLGEMAAELGLAIPAAAPAIAIVVNEPASPYAAPAAHVPLQSAPVFAGQVVMAGFWKRFAASFIDGMVMMVVTLVVALVGLMLTGGAAALNPQAFANDMMRGTLGVTFILAFYVLPILAQAVYFTWMHASASQATLGKLAVGIKVARTDGQALTLGRSFGRWCAYFFLNLVSCGVTTLISAFTVGLTERKQALHDMIADTLVVDRWAFTAHPERQRRDLGAVTWTIIVLAGLFFVAYIGFFVFAMGMAAIAGGNQ
ncbi:RDD family protein [Pseudoxanthomonas beigongshangi]|uniref:RDD family protein n=1 Tax=Pseudoxanthomonas beigongshangi TaxID=2782537 RepID=UPI00193C3352|nr:RDD family protein [Pseudoxanthomonas beigongshangi]